MDFECFFPECILYEDEHLLVVNKPCGINTHAPSPYATNGIYDYLRNLAPRWSNLAIVHRLDKETSGVLLFSKTALANRELTKQFTERRVSKKYILITAGSPPQEHFTVISHIMKQGSQFKSVPFKPGLDRAETNFRIPSNQDFEILNLCKDWVDYARTLHRNLDLKVLIAEPLTGRTHQVRLHASGRGCPVLGDALYGGVESARVWLHSVELKFRHPQDGRELIFRAPPATSHPAISLRSAILNSNTNIYRLIHAVADKLPQIFIDRFGDWLLVQTERELLNDEIEFVKNLADECGARGVYHKFLKKEIRSLQPAVVSPKLIFGKPAPEHFTAIENGVNYELSFSEGYSVGLFIDQRDNRRRILSNYIAKAFPLLEKPTSPQALNLFSYTCGFSVCAAKIGIHTVSVDLSAKYLEWGKRNFQLNQLDPSPHEFCKGDVFDWLKRFKKKGRKFDLIILDPPTFSQSRLSGAFQAWKDYPKLLKSCLCLLKNGGRLFASLNTAGVSPEKFIEMFCETVSAENRKIVKYYYATQPVDFPSCAEQPAYLKTLWAQIE